LDPVWEKEYLRGETVRIEIPKMQEEPVSEATH